MSEDYNGVVAQIQAAVITENDPVPFGCVLIMSKESPWEIVFMSSEQTLDGEPVEWHFSRELAVGAMADPVEKHSHGEGDVRMFWEGKYAFTKLINPEQGQACMIAFYKADYQQFLNACETVCPLDDSRWSMTDDELDGFFQSL